MWTASGVKCKFDPKTHENALTDHANKVRNIDIIFMHSTLCYLQTTNFVAVDDSESTAQESKLVTACLDQCGLTTKQGYLAFLF